MTIFFTTLFLYSDKSECESYPCSNGGHCLDMVNGYYCKCQHGYHGKNCEHSKYLQKSDHVLKCQGNVWFAAKHEIHMIVARGIFYC